MNYEEYRKAQDALYEHFVEDYPFLQDTDIRPERLWSLLETERLAKWVKAWHDAGIKYEEICTRSRKCLVRHDIAYARLMRFLQE